VAKYAFRRNPVEPGGGGGYSEHIESRFTHRSHIMNIAKNMEVIFFAAIALASVTGFASASANAPVSRAPSYSAAAPQATMHVVTVSAKRMTAAEKAATAE
jgi:hypothetical protein